MGQKTIVSWLVFIVLTKYLNMNPLTVTAANTLQQILKNQKIMANQQ